MAAEKNFENHVKAYLREQKAWFIKYWAGAQFTKSGVPDILACINGYFVGIEVKAPNGKPSDLQIYNVNVINRRGGYAVILYPKDFSLFKQLTNCLNNHDKKGARKLVHIINNEERRNKVG